MKVPTIHLNGTSIHTFRTDLSAVHTALRVALDDLAKAAPHGRDYYVQGPDAYTEARKEHDDRVARLSSVRDEIMALWKAIERQGK